MEHKKSQLFIPDRFKLSVGLHVIKNLALNGYIKPPLILGIQGPPGEGKTYQCELLLQEMKVDAIHIYAKDLESDRAGEPGTLIYKRYLEASNMVEEEYRNVVLFINDLDAGIGQWGNDVQYTVNTQIVYASLMAIADSPESVNGTNTARIPIIVTGNDFTKLYQPLTREGRMNVFTWIPTIDEKIEIVKKNILFNIECTDDIIASVVKEFSDMPIAFFSLMKSKLIDDQIIKVIQDHGIHDIIHYIKGIDFNFNVNYSHDQLIGVGQVIKANTVSNHLK